MKFSYWEYIKFNLLKKKKSLRQKLLAKAEQTFKEDLDVVNLVTKLHELEKLKILLLDEDQLVIFNYLSKPIIHVDENEKEEKLSAPQRTMSRLFDMKKNAKNHLEDAFEKLTARQNDHLSQKLVGFFDKEIYDFYKNK